MQGSSSRRVLDAVAQLREIAQPRAAIFAGEEMFFELRFLDVLEVSQPVGEEGCRRNRNRDSESSS